MSFRGKALTVIIFALAMAYLESAVVVYLQKAIGMTPAELFPLQKPEAMGDLAAIEVGREAATVVMLAAVGVLAGRRWVDRLAWTSVAFGVWDVFYYVWLWVFIGWPSSPGTWDVLFLIPVPWAGPVWAPVCVSLALVVFGLAAARQTDRGRPPAVDRRLAALGVLGGLVVILSFTAEAPGLMSGELPGWYPWPVFLVGMAIAAWAAATALRAAPGIVGTSADEAEARSGTRA